MKLVAKTCSTLGTMAIIAGCASTNPMNSPEQVRNLVNFFNTSCQKTGGTTGTPGRKGSEALCLKDEVSADLYINADFIFIDSRREASAANRAQAAVKSICNSKGGSYTAPYRMVGMRLINDPNNKAYCRIGTSWLGQTQLLQKENEYTLNAGVQRSPEGAPRGTVYLKDLNAALELTLFK